MKGSLGTVFGMAIGFLAIVCQSFLSHGAHAAKRPAVGTQYAVAVWGSYTKAGYEHGDLVRLKMDLILGRSHDSRCPEYEDQRGWQCLMRSGFGESKPIFRALFSVFIPQAVRVPPDPCLSFTSVPTKI
jgi:hypothetical protein